MPDYYEQFRVENEYELKRSKMLVEEAERTRRKREMLEPHINHFQSNYGRLTGKPTQPVKRSWVSGLFSWLFNLNKQEKEASYHQSYQYFFFK